MTPSLLSSATFLLRQAEKKPLTALLASVALVVTLRRLGLIFRCASRTTRVPKSQERVLILGASSGVGKELALQYVKRGARVCLVGRRADQLDHAVHLCKNASKVLPETIGKPVLGLIGDFTNPDDMVRIRDIIGKEWNGLDTLIVSAGVSALQPIIALSGIQSYFSGVSVMFDPASTSAEGIQSALAISRAAFKGNLEGPLVAALTFIPFISSTSSSPAILLVSSAAAIIPAPTRGLYGASKSASLILYQALSIENPNIAFSFVLPGTIQGDFRASAVDKGSVREADPNKHGAKPEYVAGRCIQAIDQGQKTVVFPFHMRVGHLVYWWINEKVTEYFAIKKYNYPP